MQSFCGGIRLLQRQAFAGSNIAHIKSARGYLVTSSTTSHGLIDLGSNSSVQNGASVSNHNSIDNLIYSSRNYLLQSLPKLASCSPLAFQTKFGFQIEKLTLSNNSRPRPYQWGVVVPLLPRRCITTVGDSMQSASQDSFVSVSDVPPRIKFKRLDKTAKHIMQIVDKEAVQEVRAQREIPDIKPGYIVQLRVEVPENKRRVSVLKGIVIARRNAGLNTTFRIRRLVAGVGVESLFPLYSPNIKEIKVLDKKKVRRAKLYYLRDKMNALKKH